jgi:hypothetical protein
MDIQVGNATACVAVGLVMLSYGIAYPLLKLVAVMTRIAEALERWEPSSRKVRCAS